MNVLLHEDVRSAPSQAWWPRPSVRPWDARSRSATAPVAAETEKTAPWLRRGAWDAIWLQSALWLAPLVLLLGHESADPRDGLLDVTYCWLTALLWLGHRVGSTWLAYGTTAYRPLVRAEPGRFVVAPAAIAIACFALLLPDDGALPWTRAERVVFLAVLDYVLVTHHFAAQHFGVLSLYRARRGGTASRGARRIDRLYALVVGGVLVVVAEVVAGTVCFIDLWIDPWLDPARVAAAAETIAAAATAVVVASTIAMVGREARAERPSVPRALYLAGIGAMVAAAFQVQVPFVFVVLWTTQHWLVATGLTTLVAEHEPAPARGAWCAPLHAINRRPWLLLLVLIALSVMLLPFMEVEAVADGGSFYGERIFGALATALRSAPFAPALVALGFTTGFCHYWLDRAVYRLSDARVRAAARGLFVPTP